MIDASSEDKNPVAAVANWRTRIRSEHESAQNWQSEWGFLVEDHKNKPNSLLVSSMASNHGNLRSTMAASLLKPDEKAKFMGKKKDSMDIFMESFMKEHTSRWAQPCKEIQHFNPNLFCLHINLSKGHRVYFSIKVYI